MADNNVEINRRAATIVSAALLGVQATEEPIEFDFEKAAATLMNNCYKIGDIDGDGMTRHQCGELYTNMLEVLKMMSPYLSDNTNANIATDLIGG